MRIGEKDASMPEEHRIIARYTAEKVKSHNRKSIFNLADDEVLTHKGQLLTEIEKFENEASNDDDDEDANNLEAKFVKEAHFGGGLFQKVNSDGAKSHKDLINQLILESKKRKNERLKMKEQTLELTEKLDTEWKDLLPLVSANRRKVEMESAVKPKNDDYDKVMRQLKFEVRGNPSDRLKSEEEIQKKEKEELERFEKERARRMHGGDDLEDNFMFENVGEEEKAEDAQESSTSDEDSDKEESDQRDENISGDLIFHEDCDEDKEVTEVENDVESGLDDEELEKDNEEDENIEEEDDDTISLSDLKADASASSASEDEQEEVEALPKLDEIITQSTAQEQQNEKLSIEVTFPDCYSILEGTFEYMKPEKYELFISKIIQLTAGNKEKSNTLFTYMLQYLDSSLCTFKKLAYLLPSIFEMAKVNPEKSYAAIRLAVKAKQMNYRSKLKIYPSFSLLLLLKAISVLYPTSDFRHGIVTPSVVFISQMLTCCRVKTRRDISYGLFLVTLVLEYTALSKRFLPAAVWFLTGLIHMAVPKNGVRLIKIAPPFKTTSCLLVLQQNMADYVGELCLQEADLRNANAITPVFQISALSLAIKLLTEMVNGLIELPSKCELFEQSLRFLILLPPENYPVNVKNEMEELKKCLENSIADRKLDFITAPKKKPKLLRLYEPNIEKVYDGKKYKGKSREKMERDKMLHKIKRETKGAMREIRRDQSFLGRVQINQRLHSDVERKEKVKRIYAEAANQQAELNSLDRKRKKR